MNIYKIEINSSYALVGDIGTYEAHVIAANNIEEVIRLAKSSALAESALAWSSEGVELIGAYLGNKKSPYIILSHLIYDAS